MTCRDSGASRISIRWVRDRMLLEVLEGSDWIVRSGRIGLVARMREQAPRPRRARHHRTDPVSHGITILADCPPRNEPSGIHLSTLTAYSDDREHSERSNASAFRIPLR